MNYQERTKKLYNQLGEKLFNSLKSGEEASMTLTGEETTYARFNAGKIRQNTQVLQSEIKLLLKNGNQHMNVSWSLPYDEKSALAKLDQNLQWLREQIKTLPSDDHPPLILNKGNSEVDAKGELPLTSQIYEELPDWVAGHDFCGLVASGPQVYASQNSAGQKHWFSKESFFVDYSLYAGDRAVKDCYAGSNWQGPALKERLNESARNLELMKKPIVKVKPGSYRVYLAPDAVNELVGFVGWFGLSQRAFQTGAGLFMDLGRQERSLHSDLTLRENFNLALSPQFNELGELAPSTVTMIENGKLKEWLTCTKSAQQFNVPNNFASETEHPRSLEMLPGKLAADKILPELQTGLYLSNLHYVNGSDLKTARLTGMTRYACFWVEKGEIVGPIENLRFDESLYEAWGPKLMGITQTAQINPTVATYSARALGGNKLPGMLIDSFSFTL